MAKECPQGRFSRQLFLGESLDPERVEASYDHGVLTVNIPVAEQAQAPQGGDHLRSRRRRREGHRDHLDGRLSRPVAASPVGGRPHQAAPVSPPHIPAGEVTLPDDVDEDGVEAQLDEGVLTVRLPKPERERPRRIPIR